MTTTSSPRCHSCQAHLLLVCWWRARRCPGRPQSGPSLVLLWSTTLLFVQPWIEFSSCSDSFKTTLNWELRGLNNQYHFEHDSISEISSGCGLKTTHKLCKQSTPKQPSPFPKRILSNLQTPSLKVSFLWHFQRYFKTQLSYECWGSWVTITDWFHRNPVILEYIPNEAQVKNALLYQPETCWNVEVDSLYELYIIPHLNYRCRIRKLHIHGKYRHLHAHM